MGRGNLLTMTTTKRRMEMGMQARSMYQPAPAPHSETMVVPWASVVRVVSTKRRQGPSLQLAWSLRKASVKPTGVRQTQARQTEESEESNDGGDDNDNGEESNDEAGDVGAEGKENLVADAVEEEEGEDDSEDKGSDEGDQDEGLDELHHSVQAREALARIVEVTGGGLGAGVDIVALNLVTLEVIVDAVVGSDASAD
jgi:hypothetical protein